MPNIKLPSGQGDWTMLARENGAEMWKRVMDKPDGEKITFWVVGSEHSPEITTDKDEATARENFGRAQLRGQ